MLWKGSFPRGIDLDNLWYTSENTNPAACCNCNWLLDPFGPWMALGCKLPPGAFTWRRSRCRRCLTSVPTAGQHLGAELNIFICICILCVSMCVCECIILYTQRGGCYLYTYACNYVYAHMINMFTDGAHSVLCNQTVLYPSLILHMHTYPRW